MSAAESTIGDAARPTVLVLAVPYVLATALAFKLRSRYDVLAPNLDAGETAPPAVRWDAVVAHASVAIAQDMSTLIVRLPNTSFDQPVLVTVNNRTIPVRVTRSRPIEDVVAIIEHHLSQAVGGRPSA